MFAFAFAFVFVLVFAHELVEGKKASLEPSAAGVVGLLAIVYMLCCVVLCCVALHCIALHCFELLYLVLSLLLRIYLSHTSVCLSVVQRSSLFE